MLVSQAEFARQHGVSRKTVTQWKADGRLVLQDGQVDVEGSDALLRDAGLGRYRMVPASTEDTLPVSTPVTPAGNARSGNSGADAPDLVADPETIDAFLSDLLAGRYASQAQAERVKENALAGLRALELRVKAGALIEMELAQAVFFEQARAERDAWMNWPSRIGPKLAAEFGLPADKLTEALTRHVHDELAGRGEPEPDFTRNEG